MAIIANDTQFIGIAPSVYLTEKKSALLNAQTEPVTMQDIIDTVGGGLEGSNYIFVAANGTDVENAAELKAAYILATTMGANYSNKVTIVAAPGYYNFEASPFLMNASYINLVSLDGNRSIVFNSSDPAGTINVTGSDVFIKGVDTTINISKPFTVAPFVYGTFENCKGGNYSFVFNGSCYGIFTNCEAGDYSFSSGGSAGGIYTNCVSGFYCFGYGSNAGGRFYNCNAGGYSFGAGGGSVYGTIYNCIALGGYSFGAFCYGTLNNCIAGANSFGTISLQGLLYYCRMSDGTFPTVSGTGRTVLCIDGFNNQNNQ
jgi:hypothetical protein